MKNKCIVSHTLKSKHFEVTLHIADGYFTTFGDFRTRDVVKVPKGDWFYDWKRRDERPMNFLRDELNELEEQIYEIMKDNDVPEITDDEEQEDDAWHTDA